MIAGSALVAPLAPAQTSQLVSIDTSHLSQLTVSANTIAIDPSDLTLSLKAKATMTALNHGIATTTLFNLVDSESGWGAKAEGDHGCSYGLTQINICAHPEVTKAQALDPDFNLNWAAQKIEGGKDYIYTSCNCYSLVSTKIRNLPRMAEIQPNSDPSDGAVAIFYYTDRETLLPVKHVAYVTGVSDGKVTLLEANKDHCLIDTRTVPMNDPYLAGFWSA